MVPGEYAKSPNGILGMFQSLTCFNGKIKFRGCRSLPLLTSGVYAHSLLGFVSETIARVPAFYLF